MAVDSVVELARLRELLRSGGAEAIREANHLERSEIAEEVGVSWVTVYRWEKGQRTPRGKPALKYAALLERLVDRNRK